MPSREAGKGSRGYALRTLLITFALDTVIALFLTWIGFGGGLAVNFVFSQSIGLSICGLILGALCWGGDAASRFHAPIMAGGVLVGAVLGTWVGKTLTGVGPDELLGEEGLLFKVVFMGLFFGAAVSYGFHARERAAEAGLQAAEEHMQRLASEKEAAEANLRLLQAQIEPHFLFNTLSSVLGLLETDSDKARIMLEDFTAYLRTSLSRTRRKTGSLGQEADLVKAYLRITRIRMGERLWYDVAVPEDLRAQPFPPLLVQPLVENAVRHGLEGKLDGGRITVRAESQGDRLRVVVSDDGAGVGDRSGPGLGLSNVRERLQALYGDEGRLSLQANEPSGLRAVIEVPVGGDPSDHSG